MTWRILLIATVCLCTSAAGLDAALVVGDWQNPGDGLVTIDTLSGWEWLDLTETAGMSFADVSGELGPGGMFEGFIPATGGDVFSFAQSGGIDTSTLDFPTNDVAASDLIDMVGVTGLDVGVGWKSSAGWVADEQTSTLRWVGQVTWNPRVDLGQEVAGLTFYVFPNQGLDPLGVWLYRDGSTPPPVIPEPSSILVFFGLMAAFLLTGRRNDRPVR